MHPALGCVHPALGGVHLVCVEYIHICEFLASIPAEKILVVRSISRSVVSPSVALVVHKLAIQSHSISCSVISHSVVSRSVVSCSVVEPVKTLVIFR